ncbi:calcium-dependent phospholipid binding [Balamuthia mandrillaris]
MEQQQPPKETAYVLSLNVVSGSGLAPKDSNGRADPYCVVLLRDRKGGESKKDMEELGRTHKIKKTLNPEWKASFTFDLTPEQKRKRLRFEVWDWDRIGKDDFMGCHELSLGNLEGRKEQEMELELKPRQDGEKDGYIRGKIKIQIRFMGKEARRKAFATEVTDVFAGILLTRLPEVGQQELTAMNTFSPADKKMLEISMQQSFGSEHTAPFVHLAMAWCDDVKAYRPDYGPDKVSSVCQSLRKVLEAPVINASPSKFRLLLRCVAGLAQHWLLHEEGLEEGSARQMCSDVRGLFYALLQLEGAPDIDQEMAVGGRLFWEKAKELGHIVEGAETTKVEEAFAIQWGKPYY